MNELGALGFDLLSRRTSPVGSVARTFCTIADNDQDFSCNGGSDAVVPTYASFWTLRAVIGKGSP